MRASPQEIFEAVGRAQPSRADTIARLDMLANAMDSAFTLPGTRMRVGLDAVLGVIPVFGDALSALISSYIIWEARRLGLPRWKVARMIGNVAVDSTLGAIPFVGDAFDVVFKSNRRNMKILRDHLASQGERLPDVSTGSGPAVIDAEYTVVRSRGR